MNNKRIVILEGLSAIKIMRLAYAKVFQSLGWEVFIYNPDNGEPPLDYFKRVEPSAVMFGCWENSRALVKAIQMRPHLEIILWASNWGDLDDEIIKSGHQVLRATPEEISFVEQIKQTNKLTHCFQYYHQNWMPRTHNFWRDKLGLEITGLPMAGCLFDFPLGEYNPILASSASFVGAEWKYKSINFKKYIYPLTNLDNFNLKIFGHGWNLAQATGPISTENMKHLFASSKVSLSCFEPLSDLHFDCSERIFKVMSAGGFCVSQSNKTAQEDIVPEGCIVWAEPNSPEDFISKVIHYTKHPEERLPFIKNAVRYAYSSGNYFARAKDLFSALGFFEEVISLNKVLQSLQGQLPQIEAAAIRNHERVCNAI